MAIECKFGTTRPEGAAIMAVERSEVGTARKRLQVVAYNGSYGTAGTGGVPVLAYDGRNGTADAGGVPVMADKEAEFGTARKWSPVMAGERGEGTGGVSAMADTRGEFATGKARGG